MKIKVSCTAFILIVLIHETKVDSNIQGQVSKSMANPKVQVSIRAVIDLCLVRRIEQLG
jgi:hypothetical protein